MEKALKLYNSKSAFPSADNQIEILGFNYDAKRMGGAPIITGTVMYDSCLDGVWSDDVYVEFNGEKYYLKQTPTSSKSNADARYKHECEFVSERIKLDNVYFIDAVVGNPQESDAIATNSATFSFFGTIIEFAKRLNAGLQYSKLQSINNYGEISGYYVEIGNLVDKDGNEFDKEEKLLSFDKVPFSVALQESYNQFGIPYYFEGKRIVFGFFQHPINTVFKYGADKSLLSITKNNANQKIINRCTGTGSEENIPYYYPNEHPLGIVDTYYNGVLRNEIVVNEEKFAANVKNGTILTYTENQISDLLSSLEIYNNETYQTFGQNYSFPQSYWHWVTITDFIYNDAFSLSKKAELGSYIGFNPISEKITFSEKNRKVAIKVKFNYLLESLNSNTEISITAALNFSTQRIDYTTTIYIPVLNENAGSIIPDEVSTENPLDKQNLLPYDYVYVVFEIDENVKFDRGTPSRSATLTLTATPKERYGVVQWKNENGKIVDLAQYGLEYIGEPQIGDEIKFQTRAGSLLPFQNTLMPPIYISSDGKERFYNAENETFKDENGNYYKFFNTYSDSKRKEHIVDFPDIKPSIENVKNDTDKEYINSFIGIKFDDNDSDETYEEEGGGSLKYLHPYFYVKLRKFDGEYGFNLFDHASEQGEMTISMTSGNCGACNFVIGVDENTKKNILQVDDNGDLVWDNEKGMPKFGDPQDKQNDTRNNEVWLALKKDIETYNHIMPSGGLKPAIGDTFVITNISFPKAYLRQAEERLKEAIIKFMYENNVEKFTFSIKFSRIYLEENPDVLALLNENSLIQIEYNGEKKTLYVNSFAYKMTAGEALPEITVELAETLNASQNALQTAISEVKTDVLNRVQKMDIVAMVAAKFISKETEDYAKQKVTFNRGLAIGTQDETKAAIDEMGNLDVISQVIRQYISTPQFIDGFAGTGFKLWLDENGRSNLTVDNLTTRESFRFFEMLVTKLRAVNGGLFVSAANGTIKDVVDSGDYYDIILENESTFIAGDYMRCQVMSGLKMMDYWVEIESTQGKTCRVLKSEFGDAIPLVSQEVVLDGSRHPKRQNAIHISATDDGKPRIDILDGIKTKSHEGCLRARLGDLSGITDAIFGDNQPKGHGLYSDNAYLKGEFIVKNTGQSVETMFAVQDGKIKSSVTSLQNDATKERNFLQNGSFTDGLKCWVTSNDDKLLMSNDDFIFDNENALYESVSVSSEPLYDNIHYATINRGWIRQAHYNFVDMPEFDSDKEYPLTIKFNIRCRQNSYVQVSIGGVIKYMNILPQTDDFVSYTIEKTWDGTGDFKITTAGVIDIYGISIYTEATEAKYRTFFDQSEKLITFGAEKIDDDGNTLNGSEVKVTDEGTFLNVVYQDENNERQEATLGEFKTETDESGNTTTKIKLSGDNIQLEGDVTANGKVNIRPDGTLKAFNGVFTGVIRNGIVVITKENFYTYFKKVVVTEPVENTYFTPVDNNFYSKMKIKSIPDDITYFHIFLPTYNYYDDDVWGDLGYARIDLDSAREFIGTSFYLYNEIEETGDKQQYIDVYRMRPPVEGESNWVLTGTDVNSKGFTAYEYKLFIGEEDTYGVDEAMYWEQIVKFGNMLTD